VSTLSLLDLPDFRIKTQFLQCNCYRSHRLEAGFACCWNKQSARMIEACSKANITSINSPSAQWHQNLVISCHRNSLRHLFAFSAAQWIKGSQSHREALYRSPISGVQANFGSFFFSRSAVPSLVAHGPTAHPLLSQFLISTAQLFSIKAFAAYPIALIG